MKKIILLSFLAVFAMSGCNFLSSKEVLSIEEAQAKMLSFVNDNLMQNGAEASIKEMADENGMYRATLSLPGSQGPQEVDTYMSKDGRKFFTQALDIAEVEEQNKNNEEQKAAAEADSMADIPKQEKPVVELFVMAFCPYGVIAEDAMAPVHDLLGEKADIEVRYIASIDGDDMGQVKSLHGPIEGIEGARQQCIVNNYGKDVFWEYVDEINEKCYPIYRSGDDVYEKCWNTAAKNAGVNIAKIETCVTDEGPDIIREQDEISKGYGVTGSPTLIINGARVNASRTPEGYKTAVCSAFEEQPEECSTELSSDGSGPDGGC